MLQLQPIEPPLISSLSLVPSSNSSTFTLQCTSTNSPATTAVLTKDGNTLSQSHYSMSQILRDGTMGTYDSYFSIDAVPEELVGTYFCSVLNSAGISNSEELTIQGLQVLVCL